MSNICLDGITSSVHVIIKSLNYHVWKRGFGSPKPMENKEVAICFLRNSGTDPLPPREAYGPLGSNCYSGWSVRPSVKYVDK